MNDYNLSLSCKLAATAADLDVNQFISVGFSRHMGIMSKAKSYMEG